MTLEEIIDMKDGPARTAALAAWFQGLYRDPDDPPVLVGGAAVELYTGGAYVTGDLDFVGSVPEDVAASLHEMGFRKQGRHWVREEGRVFIEIPGTYLAAGQLAVELEVPPVTVRVVSPEDALVDRLAAWKHWRSSADGVSALLIWKQQEGFLDQDRLRARARSEHVADALDSIVEFSRRLGGRKPEEEEVREWFDKP